MSAHELNEIARRLADRVFDQRLIANEYRGAFVEAMINPHLGPFGWRFVGDGWSGWDFEHSPSGSRLEVKQSAAQQAWPTDRPTQGVFDIAPRKGYYDGPKYEAVPGRCAQTYVFAWNGFFDPRDDHQPGHVTPQTDHRDPSQWEFYVVPASRLPREQRTLSLGKVRKLTAPVEIEKLGLTVNQVAFSPLGSDVD
jgi:hypothetical protein